MSEQIGGLSVDLTLEAQQYQQALRQATQQIQAASNSWGASLAAAQRSFQSALAPIAALQVAFSVLAVGGIGAAVKSALDMAGAVNDLAARTGLGTDRVQEMQYALSQVGVKGDEARAALEQFAARVGDARNATGPLVAALKDTDRALLDAVRNAPTMDAALDVVLNALARIPDAAQRAALAQEFFGRQGVKLAAVAADGAAGLEAMRARAHELGLVLNADVIAAADEAGDKLDDLARTLNTQLKAAIIALAPAISALATGLANLAAKAAGLFFETRSVKEFRADLERAARELANLNAQRETQIRLIEQGNILQRIGARFALAGIDREIEQYQSLIASLVEAIANSERAEEKKRDEAAARAVNVKALKEENEQINAEAQAVNIAGENLRAFAEERKSALALVQRLSDAMDNEAAATAALNDAYAQGAITADEYARGMEGLARQHDEARRKGEDTADVMRQLGLTFGDAFADAIVDGKRLDEVLQALYRDLLRLAVRGLVTQALASLFTPAAAAGAPPVLPGGVGAVPYASGGAIPAGELALVGENGPELFVPRVPGSIVPNSELADLGGGMTVYLDARGADPSAVARMESALRALNASIERRAWAATVDWRRRGGR